MSLHRPLATDSMFIPHAAKVVEVVLHNWKKHRMQVEEVARVVWVHQPQALHMNRQGCEQTGADSGKELTPHGPKQ